MMIQQHVCASYNEFIAKMRRITGMISDKEILARLQEFPGLTEAGWNNDPRYEFTPESCDAVRCSCVWIAGNTTKTKTIRERYGSYFLKHCVERAYSTKWYHQYVPNGALIGAALLQGYRYEIHGINCAFNLSISQKMQRQLRGY